MNERSIFVAALEITDPDERAAYLDQACGQEPGLRRHIDELLAGQDKLGSFLAHPPASPSVTMGYEAVSEGPGTRIGPYKLLQQIGEGGMGVVYMAEQEQPVRRKVALKIIKPGMDSAQVVARFEAERQALAVLDHTNIAKVFDAGTSESGRAYFVMELVHGVSITQYCDDNQLTPRERLDLFVPVCQAIQHAHQKGIIHRDIKPSNVLVTMYDDKPVPKVIDFGVAKAVEQRLTERTLFTQYGALIGTFEYMSPEQAEMNAFGVDTRSDVFALGVLLYELLTGTTPLERQRLREAALDELVRLIREEEPPRPSVRLSTSGELLKIAAARKTEPARLSKLVSGEIDWIVMKCLEKDRTRRYETASGLARDVERYLRDEAVEACPPSAWYRFGKLARRNKVALTTAAIVAAALVLGTAVSLWQTVRATRAEARVRQALATTHSAEQQARVEAARAAGAERKAKTEKDSTQSALDFLWQDVLSQASPLHEPDRNLQVRTLLDRVSDRLDKGSEQPPLVEAAVRRMVGELYTDLGEARKGQHHLEWARDVLRRELGLEDPQTLATMHGLGACFYRQLNFGAARGILGLTLETRRSVLGEEHNDTLVTMRLLGGCTPGAEGVRLLRQCLEIRSRKFGEKHQETVYTMLWLAGTLGRQCKFDEAEALGARALDLSRRLFGDGDYVTLQAMRNLARTYTFQNDGARAEPLLIEASDGFSRLVGDKRPETRSSKVMLARAYQLQDKHADAAKLIDEFLSDHATDPDSPFPGITTGLAMRGHELIRQKKYAEAEQPLRECLAIHAKSSSLPQGISVQAQILLGASLLGQEKYAEAEPLLVKGYAGIVPGFRAARRGQDLFADGPLTPLDRRDQAEALEWLVQLYMKTGKPDEAAKWRSEFETIKKTADKPEGP